MNRSRNIIEAIRMRDFVSFLEILDGGAKAACREASNRSHDLGLDVADGRAQDALKRKAPDAR